MKHVPVPLAVSEALPRAKVFVVAPPEGLEDVVGPAEVLGDPFDPPGIGTIHLYFELEDAEREALLKGGVVEVRITGRQMPPIGLGVLPRTE